MVEKIIINPNKVRGYGNIMSPHSTSDYETYASSLTSGTDTVNGQTMTVYEMTDTTLFLDVGTSTKHNDNWTLTSNIQRTRNDSYTTLSNIGSSSQMIYPISSTTKFSGDIAIEWENYATTYNNDYFIVRGTSDVAKTFGALYITKECNVKITIIGTTCKCYIDGVEKISYTINRDANSQFGVRLQINSNGDNIKYRDFRINAL